MPTGALAGIVIGSSGQLGIVERTGVSGLLNERTVAGRVERGWALLLQ